MEKFAVVADLPPGMWLLVGAWHIVSYQAGAARNEHSKLRLAPIGLFNDSVNCGTECRRIASRSKNPKLRPFDIVGTMTGIYRTKCNQAAQFRAPGMMTAVLAGKLKPRF